MDHLKRGQAKPSRRCPVSRKVIYGSEGQALKAGRKAVNGPISGRVGLGLKNGFGAYRCRDCGRWHLTKKTLEDVE